MEAYFVASGKDVWVRVSDELDELELDYADPDYVSEEEVGYRPG